MSDNDKQNPADLSGAYALNALSPEEAAEFEEFLATSEEARIEAAELGDTAVALGISTAPVQPSPSLKASLMAQLASTPQLPPLGEAGDRTTSGHPIADLSGAVAPAEAPQEEPLSGSSVQPAPAPAVKDSQAAGRADSGASASSVGPAESRARLRWYQRPAVLAASAAAAAALFFGGLFIGQAIDAGRFEQQQADALAEINAAPDAQRASAVTSDGQPATLVWSGELGLSALLIEDLPPLPAGKDYQLWYMNEEGAFSAGTFDSTGDGTVWRVLEGKMKAGDEVGVTVEPDGGSPGPTTDPLVAIQS
jgi:anti-sigma-K factor RskA